MAVAARQAHREVIRRYEHESPGAMIHVDVKKLGNIPDGAAGATSGGNKASKTLLRLRRNRAATTVIR